MTARYIPTGNEQVAIPLINENNGSIESINVLHMGYKGILEKTEGGAAS